jgi:LmbE family N-acetylglucosaminyl deacetylase
VSLLVVAPHMDDEVLGCAGLIQKVATVPREAVVLFMSRAQRDQRLDGAYVYGYSYDERRQEMVKAAQVLGYQPVKLRNQTHQLDTVPQARLISSIEAMLTGVEVLAIPAPSHDQDHNATRAAALAAARPQFYAGTVLEYMTFGAPNPADPVVVMPLSGKELAKKVQALACYETQIGVGGPEYPYSPASVVAYAGAVGRLAGAHAGEAFVPRRIVPNATTAGLLACPIR